jgi:MFS family permease
MLPRVRLTNLATLLVGFGLFGASAIISQFVQVPAHNGFGFGASASQAGLFLVPGLVLILLLAPVAGRLNSRAGPKTALVLGSTIGCVALTGMLIFHDREYQLYLWPTLMYTGVAFAFGAAPLLILEAVPAAMRGQSTAVNLIMRNIGSAIGLQLAATFITASARSSGLPTDRGFTRAFGIETLGVCAAALVALAIPRPRSGPKRTELDATLDSPALTTDRV